MGGLGFILGILATLGPPRTMFSPKLPTHWAWAPRDGGLLLVLFLAFGSGLIGFFDDFIKVIRHRNLGLTEAEDDPADRADLWVYARLNSLGLLTTDASAADLRACGYGSAYYPIAFFRHHLLVNAVNLTDGLDGLCTGVTFVSMMGYLLAGSLLGFVHVSLVAAVTAAPARAFWYGTSTRPRYSWGHRQHVLRRHRDGAGLL